MEISKYNYYCRSYSASVHLRITTRANDVHTEPTKDSMNINRPILPNGAELPDDVSFDAVHISRDTSKSTYIYLLSSLGVEECISCIQIDRRINSAQSEDYKPFIPGSHFLTYIIIIIILH